MKANAKKLKRQLLGVEKWRQAKGIGTWWWYTGVGKTYGACLIINKMVNKIKESTTIVVVPSDELRNQWNAELDVHTSGQYREKIKVYTVQYILMNNLHLECDLLILDEIHEYLADKRFGVVNGTHIKYKYILGLTATFEDVDGRHKKLIDICPPVDLIDEEEAIREGYVSEFIEYNLGVDLDAASTERYKYLSGKITHYSIKFGNNALGMAGMCLSGVKGTSGYVFATRLAKQHGWYPGAEPNVSTPKDYIRYSVDLMKYIRQRKELLYNCEPKLLAAIAINKKYADLPTIFFSQSTAFADKLAVGINKSFNKDVEEGLPGYREVCVVYHTKLKTRMLPSEKTGKIIKHGAGRLKKMAVDRMKSKEALYISTASALDKGFDVKHIRLGVTTSGTSNPTQYSQRGGRVKRVESYEEDITVMIINIYVRNTQDEKWLEKRQAKSNQVIYWVDSVDEINYRPK